MESQCPTYVRIATVSLWMTTFGGSLGERPQSGGAQSVEKGATGSNRTGCWSCKREIFEQAKVFKAHAVPHGLCANLINALKLLANQQEDGDGLLKNIVTNLGKGSRKGLPDGLRDFIRVVSDRALDVGAPRRGTGTFIKVRKREVPEGGSDVAVRQSPDDLTLRAEEVNTSKALINVNHIEPERWGPLLVHADWYAFCQALYKGIEGKDWEDMYGSYGGKKKPQEAQKAKALWAMKAAKDRREEFYDPAREVDEEHLKVAHVALDKALKCVEDQH